MSEDNKSKIRGVVAILEYMSSAGKLDVNYTQEALKIIAKELNEVLEEEN